MKRALMASAAVVRAMTAQPQHDWANGRVHRWALLGEYPLIPTLFVQPSALSDHLG